MFLRLKENNEKGSLALEQILFIGAVIAISGAIAIYYNGLGDYFKAASVGTPPSITAAKTDY